MVNNSVNIMSKQDTMVKITGFREQKGSDEAEKPTMDHKRLDERNGVSNTSSSIWDLKHGQLHVQEHLF